MDPTVQQGMGYAFIAFLGVVVGKTYDYFSNRLNTRVNELEQKEKDCEEKHKECQEERKRDKAELIARDLKDKEEGIKRYHEMEQQVNELRMLVHTKANSSNKLDK
jgi:uncharacterized membrane protein YhiD involved in acid resistance